MDFTKDLQLNHYYWVKLKGRPWEPAVRVTTDYGDGWAVIGVDADYYDNEIDEVGPEIVSPPQ